MKKILLNNNIVGYEIGDDIKVHKLNYLPNSWHITIRLLGIVGIYLCSKDCSEEEIARYVMLKIKPIRHRLNDMISETNKFTSKS